MKTFLSVIGGIVLILFGAFFVAGLVYREPEVEYTPSVVPDLTRGDWEAPVKTTAWSAEYRQAFLDGCGMDTPEYCRCTLNYLEKRYTIDEMLEIVDSMSSEYDIPKEIQDSANACI